LRAIYKLIAGGRLPPLRH